VIRGRVLDDQRRPLRGARVYVVRAPVSMPDIAQLTDEQGGFTLAAPVAGTYRIGIAAEKYAAQERDVKVAAEAPGEMLFELRKG
jgi:Carboxypeptidase regulatory-like domain